MKFNSSEISETKSKSDNSTLEGELRSLELWLFRQNWDIFFSLKQTFGALRLTWLHERSLPINFKIIVGLYCCVHLRKSILLNVWIKYVRNNKFKRSLVVASCIAYTLSDERGWKLDGRSLISVSKIQHQFWLIKVLAC